MAKTLEESLNQDKPIAEVDLADRWLKEMRKHQDIFPDGWYIPPPHGIAVLFATDSQVERASPKSVRAEKF